MCKDYSWSLQYERRRAAAARFGKIFALPVVKRVRDELLALLQPGMRVLEVGAGDRAMGEALMRTRNAVTYHSQDIDSRLRHDFESLSDAATDYDVVFALEVIEHLSLDEIREWLPQLRERLRPGGRLFLSTPNTYYPPAYLRDATHRTPLCYDELAGLVAAAGFTVERVARVYNDPLARKIARRYLFGWLFRLIGIDFAKQIVLTAKKTD